MRRLLRWIGSCFTAVGVRVQMKNLDRKLGRLGSLVEISRVELDSMQVKLDVARDKFLEEYNKHSIVIANARKLNDKLEEALEATRDQLDTANEITIPGLVEANQVLLAQWRQQVAIATMKATMASSTKGEE